MDARSELEPLLASLPEERLRQLVHFARFLAWDDEGADWSRIGHEQMARAYGPDEPEYTEADIKSAQGR